MTQTARPSSDVANTGWTPTPIYSRLNEVDPVDSSYVYSDASPEGDSFTVNLSPIAWPAEGERTLTVRMQRTDTDQVPVYVTLLQGTTPIAARSFWPSQGFVNYTMTLTAAEVTRISDYSILRVRVTAGYSVQVSCCPAKMPELITFTFSAKTGDCVCLPDTLSLLWDASMSMWWSLEAVPCVTLGFLEMHCGIGPNLFLFNFVAGIPAPDVGSTCSPLSLTYTNVALTLACTGTVTLVVTE